MLPFKPEPIEALRARVPEALAEVYQIEEIESGLVQRPGERAKHVFDFEDGARMILSKENHQEQGTAIHASFSWSRNVPQTRPAVEADVAKRLREVVGCTSGGKCYATKRAVHIWIQSVNDEFKGSGSVKL